MIIQLTHLFIINAILTITVSGDSKFITYEEPEYAGTPSQCSMTKTGCVLSEVISIKLLSGTCGQIRDSKTGNVVTITEDKPDLDYYYYGLLSACPSFTYPVECPEGTFVKHIEWDSKFNLTKGLKIGCNTPESTSPKEAIFVETPHLSLSKSEKRACQYFNKITITTNKSLDAVVDFAIGENCEVGDETALAKTSSCPTLTAVSGISLTIEDATSYIKSADLICKNVPNIAALCKPSVEREQLAMYNGTTVFKVIGVGLASELSEEETNELKFYYSFGLETEFALSTNFINNVGISKKTQYDWRSAPKSTWQKQNIVTIEIEKSALCETKLFGVVGKCSYMTVRPFHLEREDNCSGSSFTTTEEILHNVHKRSYKSKIPDVVESEITEMKSLT